MSLLLSRFLLCIAKLETTSENAIEKQDIEQISKISILDSFVYPLSSEESKRQYPKRIKLFFNFLRIPGKTVQEQATNFLQKVKQTPPQWAQDCLIQFISYERQRIAKRELSAGTLNNYYFAIKLFYEMNDIVGINWRRISKGLPRARTAANDRAPTVEELQKLVEYPDRRIKPIVYLMCSSGIRIGALENMKWKDIIPMPDGNGVAKLIVYANDPDGEPYYTFITAEAYNAVKDWMDYRESYGEKISGDSYVLRHLWPTSNIKYGARRSLATHPKKLRLNGIKRILNDALQEQNLHSKLPENSRRHEWKTSHGMRKWFKTRAEGVMKPLNVELLMGHDTGISDSYWRPTEKEVLKDYMTAADLLTINENMKKFEIEQIHNKEIEDLKAEQVAIKSVLRKIIADEQDWDPRDPEEQKRIEETFQRMMDPKGNFFGGNNSDGGG